MKQTKNGCGEGVIRCVKEGCDLAVESIDAASDYVENPALGRLLDRYRESHILTEARASDLMQEAGQEAKDAPRSAKIGTRLHTNLSLSLDGSDDRIAELLMNGCTMGMKKLSRRMAAEGEIPPQVHALATGLLMLERDMQYELLSFLGDR